MTLRGNAPVRRRIMIVLLLAGTLGAAAFFYPLRNSNPTTVLRTVPLQRCDLQATISATGTVEPEELVDVGSQVAGKIVAFGKDASGRIIDYGSMVEEGMILAWIDDALFASDVVQAEAKLAEARAGLHKAEADLGQLRAKAMQAERDWVRARKLGPSDALSQSAYDAALSAHEIAKANVAVGKAAVAQAASSVSQNEASLLKARQNLDYCTIKSPVKGIIIDRRVNIGQTVVASLNAPSLFLIAKDLRRMQVWVSVNEADIGRIHPGQPVVFTVDAFPDQTFTGTVGKIRLNASMTQNVVTYTVEVVTDNSSGKLIPYLTAAVRFIVDERPDALTVPNAALRWTPRFDAGYVQGNERGSSRSASDGADPSLGTSRGTPRGTIWVAKGDHVQPFAVTVGLTDGTQTEVQGEHLHEGMDIVIGEDVNEASSSQSTTNPFTPKLPRRRGPPPLH